MSRPRANQGDTTSRVAVARRWPRPPLALLTAPAAALLTWLLWGGAVRGFFLTDDFVWLECAMDATSDLGHVFNLNVGNFARPLAHLLNTAVYALWGLKPAPFHAAALLLHVVNLTLLTHLVAQLSRDRWLALLCALIFLLNPLYNEALLWISALNEELLACCVLATLSLWVRFLRGGPRRKVWYAACLVLFVLGAGAKESWVVLLALMVLIQRHLRLAQGLPGASRRSLAPLAAITVVYIIIQGSLQQGNIGLVDGRIAPGFGMLARISRTMGAELWTHLPLLVPLPLLLWRWRRAPALRRRAAWAALNLGLAGALVMLPPSLLTFSAEASRFYYLPSMVAALGGALLLRGLVTSGRLAQRIVALVALSLYLGWHLFTPDQHVKLYLQTAQRSRRLIHALQALPAPREPLYLLNCPLGPQHISAMTRLYHHSRSPQFIAVTPKQVLAVGARRWVWRWYPAQDRFFLLEDTRRRRR